MKKLIPILLFLSCQLYGFGQFGGAVGIGYGRIIPSHREYPEIQHNSVMVSMAGVWQTNGSAFRWAEHYNFPTIRLGLSYHWLGNPDVIGHAVGVLPSMSFYLKRGQSKGFKFEAGSGISFLSRPYHFVDNPRNDVYGSKFNFFFSLALAYEIEVSNRFACSFFVSLPHYSTANLHQPNLGVNTFMAGINLQHLKKASELRMGRESELPEFNKKIKPFLRFSYGLTRSATNGPAYPVYVGGIGVGKLVGRFSRINTGFEYIFDSSRYHFLRHIFAFPDEEFKQASRFTWHLGHEWLFGHLGFLTEAGLYLNDHYGRLSIFTTKLGLNFYPRNTLDHSSFMPFFGAYVRAYAGEADFFEMTVGIVF